jgi:hypothetical protein
VSTQLDEKDDLGLPSSNRLLQNFLMNEITLACTLAKPAVLLPSKSKAEPETELHCPLFAVSKFPHGIRKQIKCLKLPSVGCHCEQPEEVGAAKLFQGFHTMESKPNCLSYQVIPR